MSRPSALWFRKQTGCYMTTVRGEQHNLGPDKAEATRRFHALLAQADPDPTPARVSFRKLADLYLAHSERAVEPNTFKTRLLYLKQFCARLGTRAVADLKVFHVSEWEAANPHWSHSTVVTVRGVVIGCLNWGEQQGLIPANPIPRLKAGKTSRRERVLTAEERDRIRAAVPPAMMDFLLALELTGARPFSEVAKLTAGMIDWAAGVIPLARHKNAKKGKTRVIYLTPPLEALLRRKCQERPDGPLFLSPRRARFTAPLMAWWLRRLERRLGIPRLNVYCVRHAAITSALENGITGEVAAELFGNSAETINQYYSQLSARREAMKAAAARAVS